MADQVLARNYVEFIAQGLGDVDAATAKFREKLEASSKAADGLKKALDSGTYKKVAQETAVVDRRLAGLNEQARKVDMEVQFGKKGAAIMLASERLGKFNEKLGHFNEGAKKVGGVAAMGFAVLTGAVMGFVRAGLQGTVQGEMLQMRMQLLSREIAGIFLPVIDAVTSKIQSLVNWFRKLSGEKQNLILKFVMGAAAGLAVAMVLPKIVAGIQIVIVGIKMLMAAIAAMGAEAGIASGGITIIAGALVTAAAALGVFMFTTKAGAGGLEKLQVAGQQLVDGVMPKLMRAVDSIGVALEKLATVGVPLVVAAFDLWVTQLETTIMVLEKLIKIWKYTPFGIAFDLLSDDDGKGKPKDDAARRTPTQSGSGFEDFMATYKRIAGAAMSSGVSDPAERAAKAAERIADQLPAWQRSLDNALVDLLAWLLQIKDKVARWLF